MVAVIDGWVGQRWKETKCVLVASRECLHVYQLHDFAMPIAPQKGLQVGQHEKVKVSSEEITLNRQKSQESQRTNH